MIIVALALFGLIFGSFVNALVWRLHAQAELAAGGPRAKGPGRSKKQPKLTPEPSALTPAGLSILKGRSMCPHCHHTLAAEDLIPLLSWVSLKGKCHYCGKPISWQYPAVELLTGVLFVVSYLAWPLSFSGDGLFQFIIWLGFLVGFVALAVYDLRWYTLPDRLVFPLTGLAIVETAVNTVWLRSWSALWEPIAGAVIIFGLFWVLYQVSRGAWIGGGDVKLGLMLGLVVATPLHTFLVIFFASLVGTVVSLPLLMRGKQGLKLHIPFGPYLLLATVIVVLWGSAIVAWYQRLLWG